MKIAGFEMEEGVFIPGAKRLWYPLLSRLDGVWVDGCGTFSFGLGGLFKRSAKLSLGNESWVLMVSPWLIEFSVGLSSFLNLAGGCLEGGFPGFGSLLRPWSAYCFSARFPTLIYFYILPPRLGLTASS